MKILIGLTGHKTCGKDTVANMLVPHFRRYENFIYHRIGFADALKQEVARLTGGTVEAINAHKAEPLCRKLLQYAGQEAKNIEADDLVWVNRVKDYYNRIEDKHRIVLVIVPDVRFSYEAVWVKREGGLIVRIFRPEADALVDDHPSETEIHGIMFDHSITNDGTLRDLERDVKFLAAHIKEHYKI